MSVNLQQTGFQIPQQQNTQVAFKAQMPVQDAKVLSDAFETQQAAVSFGAGNPLKALPVQQVKGLITGVIGLVKSKMDAVVNLVKTGVATVKALVSSIIKKGPPAA